MHFFTILALATFATAGVAGGRKPTRPLWNQRGPVRAGHNYDSTEALIEKTQNLARDARDAVEAQPPFKVDDEYEGKNNRVGTAKWPKVTSGLYDAWASVAHGVGQKANEAVELAKAQAAIRHGYANNKASTLGQRDVEDEAEVMHDLRARSKSGQHSDAARVKNWNPPPRPASERFVQRSVDVDEESISEYDRYLAARNVEAFEEEEEEDDLAARDSDDDDDSLDWDHNEDDLAAHEPTGEEEGPSGEPVEDTLDDTPGLTARDADPEARRLFRLLGVPQSKVFNLVGARDVDEEDEYEDEQLAARAAPQGVWPTGTSRTDSGVPVAPQPQLAHQTHGSGRQRGHFHHAEPEMQAGPKKTRSQNDRRALHLD